MSRVRAAMRLVTQAALVAGALLAGSSFAAPLRAQPLARPRLDASRVAGEMVVGAYVGVGGYFLGRHLGHEVADVFGASSDVTIRRAEFIGSAAGGILATSGAVYGIGNIGDQTGDFDSTVLGATVGFAVGVGVARLILGPELRPSPGMSTAARWTIANVLAFMPAIGATIAFNSTRRSQ